MRLAHVCMFLAIISCGKKSDSVQSGPSIASIPNGCKIYTEGGGSGQGWHEWPDRSISLVTAYDCGMREGKRCFYFLGQQLTPQHDVICQEP